MAEQILQGVARSLINSLASAALCEYGRINGVMDELERGSRTQLNLLDLCCLMLTTNKTKVTLYKIGNFIIQMTDGVPGDSLKYATNFSEAISEGILRENHDHVPALPELITLGFVMKSKSEEVDFLMESKNLQIDLEDEEFLSSAFPFD
ncbi:hypothetical protein P8452_68444 [Trifolium repens]|nr:hypothetical protein P8452_68444 [Trifolium repens]